MNGISEPLPGLLDDPLFAITDLPALTDFHIAPLRNPAPLKHTNVPSPLEPVTANTINNTRSSRRSPRRDGLRDNKRTPKITPSDVLLARESKKPHLAISELLEDNDGPDSLPQQLPSFISLSVVEKSPIQASTTLEQGPAQKRPRLEQDGDHNTHDFGRQLPRPAQKEVPISRPAPLLPAMVTGLHEPPPSAALLPSIDLDKRPALVRTMSAKIQVKDILRDVQSRSPSPGASARLPPTASFVQAELLHDAHEPSARIPVDDSTLSRPDIVAATTSKDTKARRARRKWTDAETKDLLAGVLKHGAGKWKQILEDPAFSFTERSSVDLKDRYRVCLKDDSLSNKAANNATPAPGPANPRLKESNATREALSPSPPLQGPLPETIQNKQRRKRRAWTAAEDESLLKGVARHGFQWTAIHDDSELELDHRRATDLRDRIRNKFPESYKHAESAPRRSEVKKAEKEKQKNGYMSGKLCEVGDEMGGRDNVTVESAAQESEGEKSSTERGAENREQEKEKEPEKAGVTLPSLTLDDDDMDWDNRLPPLLPWDEIGE